MNGKRFLITPDYLHLMSSAASRLAADNPQGLTTRQIADELDVPSGRAQRILAFARKLELVRFIGGSGANKLWAAPEHAEYIREQRRKKRYAHKQSRLRERRKLYKKGCTVAAPDDEMDTSPIRQVIVPAGIAPPPPTRAPRCIFEWRP